MPKAFPRLCASLLALLAAALPGAGAAQQEACQLNSGTLLTYSGGEDADFFTSQGGPPNLVFLLDNSGSINRMAPDGAVNTWGSFGDSYGCASPTADAFAYSSPCGNTSEEGNPYKATADYGDLAKVCPYLTTGAKVQTGAAGFDPDYYCSGGGSSCNGHPNFFDQYSVFHDNDFSSSAWSARCDTTATTGIASGCKGFEADGPYAAATSIASYCSAWQPPSDVTLTATDLANRRSSCNTCLSTKGYWYSGYYYKNSWMQADPRATDDTSRSPMACGSTDWCRNHGLGICVDRSTLRKEYNGGDSLQGVCRFPHLYFAGNFLNFHPPKFVVLRKVMKDVLMDTRRIRMALVTLNGTSGGTLVKGLNPACNLVYPPSPSNFDSNRSSILNALSAVSFDNSTPIAEALFEVGEMYRSPTLPWFNSTYQNRSFEPATGSNQQAICFSCQKSSVVVITDGLSNYDDAIPGSDFAKNAMTLAVSSATGSYAGMAGYNIKDIDATTCPLCNTTAEQPEPGLANCDALNPVQGACGPSGPVMNYLPKVAWYLHHMDFRLDTDSGADCAKMAGKQHVDVYTIGYGLSGTAAQILAHAAYRDPYNPDSDVGGGISATAQNVMDLKNAILAVFDDINSRSTSFGSASVATLQATAAIGTLVPRFEPNKSAHWNGHLYQFQLFSEFSAGCKPTAPGQPLDPNDKDCDHDCRSIFLVDKAGAFIQENDAGLFVKNNPPSLPPCGATNLCGTCGAVGTVPAEPIWEAGDRLNQVTWRNRKVYTVVDFVNKTLQPLSDDTATANLLATFMGLGGNGPQSACKIIVGNLRNAGNALDANAIDADLAQTPKVYTSCAQAVIRYLLGADLFNAAGLTNPTFRNDRPAKLGDIFHSSPVQVYPPFRRSSCTGDNAPNQCVPTLHSVGEGAADAYDAYYAQYRTRDRLVVVGANDGLLHAFHLGSWHPGDDPRTTYLDESTLQYPGYHDDGTGDEVWAFLPPDLLSKVPQYLGTTHQFFVDGTAMVRDVWVDGTSNDAGSGKLDNAKQAGEFHTVLIGTERRGGNHHFALDVTNATGDNRDGKPTFLWMYPQPDDPAALATGESWSDFAPKPPPIGPVKIDANTDDNGAGGVTANTDRVQDSTGNNAPYHERWIAFLSGGFDFGMSRGHGVTMVDVWTGKTLWTFAQPAQGGGVDQTDPRRELRFPVAAGVGMVSFGKDSTQGIATTDKSLFFFDTATFGDVGGQLWVLRFYNPGVLSGSPKRISNWVGARLLQSGRIGCSTLSLGQPFFTITSNFIWHLDGTLHVIAGQGDRMNLLDTAGGTCGPDNLRACLLRGCTVQVDESVSDPGSLGTFAVSAVSAAGPSACFPMDYTQSAASGTCGTTSASTVLTISNCPNPLTGDTDTGFTNAKKCTPDGESWDCEPTTPLDEGVKLQLGSSITQGNKLLSLLVFHPTRRPVFNTAEEAKAYDARRLTDTSSSLVAFDGSVINPTQAATTMDDGWYYYFTHDDNVTINGLPYSRVRQDERVVGSPVVAGYRVFFNTIQPLTPVDTGGTGSCSKSPCKGQGRQQFSYLYGADLATGKPGLTDVTGYNVIPPIGTPTPVPPQPPVEHIFVNSAGQVMKGLVSVPVGAAPTNYALTGAEDATLNFGWIDVDASTHACRHRGDAGSCR